MSFKQLIKQAFGNTKRYKMFYIVIFIFAFLCTALINSVLTFYISFNSLINNFSLIDNSIGITWGNKIYEQNDAVDSSVENYYKMSFEQLEDFKTNFIEDFGLSENDKLSKHKEFKSFILNWSKSNFDLNYVDFYDRVIKKNNLDKTLHNLEKYNYNYLLYYLYKDNDNNDNIFDNLNISNYWVSKNISFKSAGLYLFLNPNNEYEHIKMDKNIEQPKIYKQIKDNERNTNPGVWVTPAFASRFNVKFGDNIPLIIPGNPSREFQIIGYLTTLFSINEDKNNSRTIYVDDENYFLNKIKNYQTKNGQYFSFANFNTSFSNDNMNQQEIHDKLMNVMNDHFSYINEVPNLSEGIIDNSDGVFDNLGYFSLRYDWIKNSSGALDLLLNVIIWLTFTLFVVVLWFAILELIKKSKKDLIFLRSIGISRFQLSSLSALTALIPITFGSLLSILLVAPIGSQFSNIWIKIINTYMEFWDNLTIWSLFIAIIMITIIGLIFLLITFTFLRPKNLHISSVTKPGIVELGLNKVSSKIFARNSKIRISFAYMNHNFFKVIAAFLIISLGLTVVLFTTQFKISTNEIAKNPQKINYYNYQFQLKEPSIVDDKNLINNNTVNTTYSDKLESDFEKDNLTLLFDNSFFLQNMANDEAFIASLNSKFADNLLNITKFYINGEQIKLFALLHQKILNNVSDNSSANSLTKNFILISRNMIITYSKFSGLDSLTKDVHLTFKNYYFLPDANDQTSISFFGTKAYIGYSDSYNTPMIYAIDSDSNPFNIKNLKSISYENAKFSYMENGVKKWGLNIDVGYEQIKSNNNLKVGDVYDMSRFWMLKGRPSDKAVKIRINSINKENLTDDVAYVNKRAFFQVLFQNHFIDYNLYNSIRNSNWKLIDNFSQTNDVLNSFMVKNFVMTVSNGGYGSELDNWDDTDDVQGNIELEGFAEKGTKIIESLSNFIELTQKINFGLFIILAVIILVVVQLVLMQNISIILMLKTMGYKLREVIFKILIGYIIGLFASIAVSAFLCIILITTMTTYFLINYGVILVFINSWQFYTILTGFAIGVISIIFVSAQFTWINIKPNEAFDTLTV
ncbi:hypothetical protein [Spiroplasma endosymbiont of Labia minor]|uniref:hypothetical protein n=1 Tax=Spiroplasma endosymbiont of Labia minor TaxID=3066305 RepID=UPI0030D267FF